jgi:hypothetical protein
MTVETVAAVVAMAAVAEAEALAVVAISPSLRSNLDE